MCLHWFPPHSYIVPSSVKNMILFSTGETLSMYWCVTLVWKTHEKLYGCNILLFCVLSVKVVKVMDLLDLSEK